MLQKSLHESLLFKPSSFVLDLEQAYIKAVSLYQNSLDVEDIYLSR